MAGNPRVLGLLEEMLYSGRTPEEVCHNCPELLAVVRQRWQAFRRIDAEVEALIPEPGSLPAGGRGTRAVGAALVGRGSAAPPREPA